ncbi:MAG: TolC family outer membrane protein [Cellvibrionales bacterium]|nr:TolC family outer membrane protein [Cellvibrionales bacterium]
MLATVRAILILTILTGLNVSVNAETLSDIYKIAVKNDPVILAAKANYNADKETLKQGRAVLLPQLAGSANKLEPQDPTSTNPDKTTYSASLSQSLFNVPAWFQFKSAKNMDQVAEATFAANQQDLIIRVSETYFNVLRAYENKQTREAELSAISRQLEQTQERFEVGLLPITDVYEIQAIFDEATANNLEASGALDIAFEKLQSLTGQSHDELSGLKDSFIATSPDPIDVESWVEFSLANNFTLKASQLAHQAANATATAAKAQHLPKITISTDYRKIDQQPVDNFYGEMSEQTSVNLNLTMPIFSGGLTSSQARQSSFKAKAAKHNFIAAKRNTIQAARSTHQQVMTNIARVKARTQATKSAESALKATQAGYEVGTRNIVDVLLAQRTVFQAKRNFAGARYDYILSMLRLKQVAGQLSPEDVFEINNWLSLDLSIN